MAVTGERQVGCEGCGRTVPLEELTTVQMPDGDCVACCSACVSHAKAAAEKSAGLDQRRSPCDGCTDEFLDSELETVTLSDGTTIDCCASCAATVPQRDADEPSETTEPAVDQSGRTDKTLCYQCNEWVAEELFRVTTIDGRDEQLCSTCKERAEDNGILKDVDLRKSRARDILDVEPGASDEAIRNAYHRQVKRAHPDQQSGSRSAFHLVKDAYNRLQESDH